LYSKQTLGLIETDAVFIFDDDVFLNTNALQCMLAHWIMNPNRLVGPFVRVEKQASDGTYDYILDELHDGQNYSMVIPRSMILHRHFLSLYANNLPHTMRGYVNSQSAHCDDIMMNAMVANYTKAPPLRVSTRTLKSCSFQSVRAILEWFCVIFLFTKQVLLPADSVTDHFQNCLNEHRKSGLAAQGDRKVRRRDCLNWIIMNYKSNPLRSTDDVGVCTKDGVETLKSKQISPEDFKDMTRVSKCWLKVQEETMPKESK
jgi:hypothetical protein